MTQRMDSKGFTLVELLIVMGMLGFVLAATYSIFLTHQRTAMVDEEVVDVQQNLRIGMDSMGRDIRLAGMMIGEFGQDLPNPNPAPGAPPSDMVPIGKYEDNTGVAQDLPAPDNIKSDSITLNMAAGNAGMSIITEKSFTTTVSPGTEIIFKVNANEYFEVEPVRQVVRIIRPTKPNKTMKPGNNTYTVEGVGTIDSECGAKTAPCLKLQSVGGDGTTVTFMGGDMIIRTGTILNEKYPSTVAYSLVSGASCPTGPYCLQRDDGTPGGKQVIATNMTGLQFSYILDMVPGNPINESSAPPDLGKIRAVRATLWSRTSDTARLSGGQTKSRQMTSVIKIRNRYLK